MNGTPQENAITRLLLIEDNPVDLELLQLALEEEKNWRLETMVVKDGEKAISLLQDQAADPQSHKPDLIVLDLNLPRRDGTEVLRMIRSTLGLSSLPVAVLSSSPGDVIARKLTAAAVTADGLFTKPGSIDDFLKIGKALRDWFEAHQHRKTYEEGSDVIS